MVSASAVVLSDQWRRFAITLPRLATSRARFGAPAPVRPPLACSFGNKAQPPSDQGDPRPLRTATVERD